MSYLLIETIPGRPYDAYDATPEQTSRVLEQVAEIIIELSKHKFPKAGSLVMSRDGEIEVGEVASNRLLHLGRHGPFSSAIEYFSGTAAQYLDHISDGQPHTQAPLKAYLFYTLAQSQASSISSEDESGEFFLKRVDDKGDHILVDDEYKVVGSID